jgi:signal transduction histidine kinase
MTAEATLVTETERTIRADQSRLEQFLENQFRNAVEHGGDEVTVTVNDVEEEAGFAVADDGPGIPEAERDRVFDPGFSTDEDGTGVGLAIIREIAQAHGWECRASESEDGGARFEFPIQQ